ncbi:MAG TPA: hemolysin family protein [Planctomycetota bacterium]|nr:hemolysin family protein [Planctomycetota bacterium]
MDPLIGQSPEPLAAILALAKDSLYLLVACGTLLLAAVFALFENALQHHNRVHLTEEANRVGKTDALDAILLQEEEILFVSKIARGLATMVAIAMIVVYLVHSGVSGIALGLWVVFGPALVLFVTVAGPYLVARRAGHIVLLKGLLPYAVAIVPLRPLAAALHTVAARVLGRREEAPPNEEIAEEILSVVEEGTREGALDAREKEMIEGVIDLRGVTAGTIMTPRTDLVCIPIGTTAREAIEHAGARRLSRLPVYRETPDDIIGILHLKDLLPYLARGEAPPIEKLLRRPLLVPESKNVGDLLHEMKASRMHMAVVLDEYGGTAGVVTIEDILEEIVGEIEDEHESGTDEDLVLINENAATVDGRAHVHDLNKALRVDVPESDEYDTIGGFLFSLLGRVPEPGEHCDLDGIRFTILEADERRIGRVKVSVRRAGAVEP